MKALRRLSLLAAALVLPAGAHADEPETEPPEEPAPLDMDMLEFIGSWEGDDDDWLEMVNLAEYEVERELKVSTVAAEDEADEE